MGKSKLFLDFDNTLVNSTKQFCKVYNILYADYPEFKPADYTKVINYNFTCQCPLVNNVLSIFEQELFFEDLEFINDNTYEILEKLNRKYQIIIVTIGTPLNLARKAMWLKENLPFIKDYILLNNGNCKMDKSLVDMSGKDNVFIDDIPSNLLSSNCETKILFGEIFSWNNDWNGEYALTWSDIEERLL